MRCRNRTACLLLVVVGLTSGILSGMENGEKKLDFGLFLGLRKNFSHNGNSNQNAPDNKKTFEDMQKELIKLLKDVETGRDEETEDYQDALTELNNFCAKFLLKPETKCELLRKTQYKQKSVLATLALWSLDERQSNNNNSSENESDDETLSVDCLETMLQGLDDKKTFELMSEQNTQRRTVLHLVAMNKQCSSENYKEVLEKLLIGLSSEQLYALLTMADGDGKTVVAYVADRGQANLLSSLLYEFKTLEELHKEKLLAMQETYLRNVPLDGKRAQIQGLLRKLSRAADFEVNERALGNLKAYFEKLTGDEKYKILLQQNKDEKILTTLVSFTPNHEKVDQPDPDDEDWEDTQSNKDRQDNNSLGNLCACSVEKIFKGISSQQHCEILCTEDGLDAMHMAVQKNTSDVLGSLLTRLNDTDEQALLRKHGFELLCRAANSKSCGCVERLLEHLDAKICYELLTQKNEEGATALQIAADNGSVEMLFAMLNRLDMNKCPELLAVCSSKNTPVLHLLLKKQVDSCGDKEVKVRDIEFLLRNLDGAQKTALLKLVDARGRTFLHRAFDLYEKDRTQEFPDFTRADLTNLVEICLKDLASDQKFEVLNRADTLFVYAVLGEHQQILDLMLAGLSVRQKYQLLLIRDERYGYTAFDWAFDCKNFDLIRNLLNGIEPESLVLALKSPRFNCTVLHRVVQRSSQEGLEAFLGDQVLLLRQGNERSARFLVELFKEVDEKGNTVLQVAQANGPDEMVKYLQDLQDQAKRTERAAYVARLQKMLVAARQKDALGDVVFEFQ